MCLPPDICERASTAVTHETQWQSERQNCYTVVQGLAHRGSRAACGSRTPPSLLAQDAFNRVRVLRTENFVLLQLVVQARWDVRQSKQSGILMWRNLASCSNTHKIVFYRKWRSVTKHMNKTGLLPTVTSCFAAPKASLFGHPWYNTFCNPILVLSSVYKLTDLLLFF